MYVGTYLMLRRTPYDLFTVGHVLDDRVIEIKRVDGVEFHAPVIVCGITAHDPVNLASRATTTRFPITLRSMDQVAEGMELGRMIHAPEYACFCNACMGRCAWEAQGLPRGRPLRKAEAGGPYCGGWWTAAMDGERVAQKPFGRVPACLACCTLLCPTRDGSREPDFSVTEARSRGILPVLNVLPLADMGVRGGTWRAGCLWAAHCISCCDLTGLTGSWNTLLVPSRYAGTSPVHARIRYAVRVAGLRADSAPCVE